MCRNKQEYDQIQFLFNARSQRVLFSLKWKYLICVFRKIVLRWFPVRVPSPYVHVDTFDDILEE